MTANSYSISKLSTHFCGYDKLCVVEALYIMDFIPLYIRLCNYIIARLALFLF